MDHVRAERSEFVEDVVCGGTARAWEEGHVMAASQLAL
jgi:hypothetical protein